MVLKDCSVRKGYQILAGIHRIVYWKTLSFVGWKAPVSSGKFLSPGHGEDFTHVKVLVEKR